MIAWHVRDSQGIWEDYVSKPKAHRPSTPKLWDQWHNVKRQAYAFTLWICCQEGYCSGSGWTSLYRLLDLEMNSCGVICIMHHHPLVVEWLETAYLFCSYSLHLYPVSHEPCYMTKASQLRHTRSLPPALLCTTHALGQWIKVLSDCMYNSILITNPQLWLWYRFFL